jgi:glycosyltransferase involved in cell wall biosynthesis
MKLLIFAQKIDVDDPVLGFFHNWILEFAKYYEFITVICLYKGKYNFPENVKVLSLGKEEGESRFKYIKNFYKYIFAEKDNYDKVFVHMNQEYVLLGGPIWNIWKKDVYMWRNHHAGSILTDLAAVFCKKVFCTSKFSYTAKYKRTVIMPVGVDMDNFQKELNLSRENKILFLGRISPVKKVDLFVEAMKKVDAQADIYGDAGEFDKEYLENLRKNATKNVTFMGAVSKAESPKVYQSHNIFVNLSSNGMYDKTIFEAMISGCLVLVSNDNLRGEISDDFIFKQDNLEELVMKLEKLLKYTEEQKQNAREELKEFARKHSLKFLIETLSKTI